MEAAGSVATALMFCPKMFTFTLDPAQCSRSAEELLHSLCGFLVQLAVEAGRFQDVSRV